MKEKHEDGYAEAKKNEQNASNRVTDCKKSITSAKSCCEALLRSRQTLELKAEKIKLRLKDLKQKIILYEVLKVGYS